MTNTRLSRWTRALGAAVLVVAVLPLSTGPASADSSGNPGLSGRGSDKAAERCLEKDNGRGNDCPAAEAAASLSPTVSAPAPQAQEKAPAPAAGAPAVAADAPAEVAKEHGKPAVKENNGQSARSENAPASGAAPPAAAPAADKAKKSKATTSTATTAVATTTDKKPDSPKGGGHTPVNICHATGSDSNPYVFITVDDGSVQGAGHLAHRNEPNKTWNSDGIFRGAVVRAGDPKPDLIGDYTDSAGVRHIYDGVINSEADCGLLTPPPPPPVLVKAAGSFATVCTPTAAVANIGKLTMGSATPGSFRLAATGFSVAVASNQVNVAVPADTVLRLEYVPASGSVQVLQTLKSEKACPTVTPPTTGELTKTSVPPSGSVVTPGQVIDYTVTVSNTGTVAITNAPVVDTLPTFVTVVPGSVTGGGVVSPNGRTITWTVTLTAAGTPDASKTFMYKGQVDANAPTGASLLNKVTFLLMERTTTHPVGDRSLEVRKSVSSAVGQFGDTLTYTLTVKALGTLGQTMVVVRDGIPAGTTYVSGSAACDRSPCTADFKNNEVTWELGAMDPGTSRTVTFRVTINTPPVSAGGGIPGVTIRNVGLASSNQVSPTPSNEVVTDVVAVGGVKSGPKDSGGSGGPGGGPGGGPNTDDDVSVAPTSGGPLAHTGAGLPFGAIVLFGGLLLLGGIALLRVGLSGGPRRVV